MYLIQLAIINNNNVPLYDVPKFSFALRMRLIAITFSNLFIYCWLIIYNNNNRFIFIKVLISQFIISLFYYGYRSNKFCYYSYQIRRMRRYFFHYLFEYIYNKYFGQNSRTNFVNTIPLSNQIKHWNTVS